MDAQSNDSVNEKANVQGENCPPDQKKAKEYLKRGSGEACMEAFDMMWAKKEAFDRENKKNKEQRYLAALELENKRLTLEEKKVEADLMEKEDKIMSTNMILYSLTTTQLQYYQIMQAKIVAHRLSN